MRPIASSAAVAEPASTTVVVHRLQADAQRVADVLLVVDDEDGEARHGRSLACAAFVPRNAAVRDPADAAPEPQAAMRVGHRQCNLQGRGVRQPLIVRALLAAQHGTRDAVGPMQMKDLVLIGVSVAFFVVAWVYARSFDHL